MVVFGSMCRFVQFRTGTWNKPPTTNHLPPTISHYDFENGLLDFTLLRLSLSRLLALTLIVGRLTLSIRLDIEAIETQAMFGERAAQRILLRLEPLPDSRHVCLHVCLEPAVLYA